jgi:GAF domain-containing protein
MPRRRQGVEAHTDPLTRGLEPPQSGRDPPADVASREIERLAAEQAALRRVATLVAQEASATDLFTAVAHEVGTLFGTDLAGMARFDEDAFTLVASSNEASLASGTRHSYDQASASAEVYRTGHSARLASPSWEDDGLISEAVRRLGVIAAVASPIVVRGELWGTLSVASTGEPLPPDTEDRLEKFAELVATAIANSEARVEVERLAQEQAALRRVATLVAEEASREDIVGAIAEEAANVLGEVEWALARDDGDGVASVLAVSPGNPTPAGARVPIDSTSAFGQAIIEGQPARIDDYFAGVGPIAQTAREHGIRAVVSCPVVVRGRTWGAMSVGWRTAAPLPAETEAVLDKFSDLIASAIANAEARDEVERLAAEQAALSRVATLVAGGVPSAELFSAVSTEVAHVFSVAEDSPLATVIRFDSGSECVLMAASSPYEEEPVGSRWTPKELYVSTHVLRTGASARVDDADFAAVGGADAELLRRRGFLYQVGSPVIVEGQVWGAMTLNSSEPLPADTDQRLAGFTELVAIAISNAEAGDALAVLADEQAALRRVATLVAGGIRPEEVFRAVAAEVGVLFGSDVGAIVRFEDDRTVTVLGDVGGPHEAHKRVTLDPGYAVDRVRETGLSARFDTDDPSAPDMPSLVRALGIRSAVASPIVVQGGLWGAVTIASLDGPLPPSAEHRLTEFTELVAAAIANTEAREEVTVLAHEQAALRRVAELVARESSPTEVFGAVTHEASKVLDAEAIGLLRFEPDGSATLVAQSETPWDPPRLGTQLILDGHNPVAEVARTGEVTRMDDWSDATGAVAAMATVLGVRSTVATPIVVEGRLWGTMIAASSSSEPLPAETESRVAQFTELVATAIANAEARGELSVLVKEQAALRRVATLVADQAAPDLIFASVAQELARAVDANRCAIGRYEEADALTVVGYWSDEEQQVPPGTRIDVETDEVVAAVRRSGQLLRIDDHEAFSGPLMDYARTLGALPTSTIAAPVFVGGRLWGTIFTSTMAAVPFPEGTEARVVDFAELVATAIANADSREALAGLVEEQAALRRVATLVAEGVPPTDIFDAVSKEVQGVLHLEAAPSDVATVVRFESPTECVLVGASKPIEESALGSRWEPHDAYVSTRVLRTGKSARLEEDDLSMAGPEADKMRRQGYFSQVACPIVVEGRLWGAMTASATEPLPPETEGRLEKFTELIATAIANAQGKSELAASRRRIVAASDATRRRIERDLHDGTQQRLVSLGLALRAAEENVPPDRPELRAELSRVVTGLAGAVEDLQELSRGIHPAILSRGGLVAALRTLARRSEIPVDLDASVDVPVPEPVEVAAYFVASEALANAIKHAEPSRIDISLLASDGHLHLTIRDDGVGGADSGRGSGLVGLMDRVDALGGSLEIDSRLREGTQVTARLPLDLETADAAAPV